MKTSGMFWHIHHDVLYEWTNDIQERIDYIRKEKPQDEIKTRLRLMKPIKGNLPDEFDKAQEAYVKAWEAYVKASEAYVKASEAHDKAWEAFKPKLETLHKKECGCEEWNGARLIFKKGNLKVTGEQI